MSNHEGGPPAWLTASYLEEMLRSSLKAPNLRLTAHSIGAGSALGDNYAGQIFRIAATLDRGEGVETLSVIAKHIKHTAVVAALSETLDVFENEAALLGEVLRGVHAPRYFPEVYHIDRERRTIFLEDLAARGFRMADRSSGLDLDHAILAVEAAGRHHAATLHALQDDPSIRDKFQRHLFSKKNELMDRVVKTGYEHALEALPSWPVSEDIKARIRMLGDDVLKRTYESASVKEARLSTILHGDLWVTNMMFRYVNDKPVEVKLLDYQVAHYNGVAYDLVYFIFSSVHPDVVTTQLDTLLRAYCSAQGDADFETIKREVEERLFCGVACSFFLVPAILTPRGQAVDLESMLKDPEFTSIDGSYTAPAYLDYVSKMMPFYLKHNVI